MRHRMAHPAGLLPIILGFLVLAPLPAAADLKNDERTCSLAEDVSDAIGACTRLIDSKTLKPSELQDAYVHRARTYLALYEQDEAGEDIARAGNISMSGSVESLLVNYYVKTWKYEAALPILDKHITRSTMPGWDRKEELALFGEIYYENYLNRMLVNYFLGKVDQARRDFDEALAIDSKSPKLIAARCKGRALAGDLTNALADCDAAIGNPRRGLDERGDKIVAYEVFVTRGIVNLRLGRLDEALEDFARTSEYNHWLPPQAVYGRGLVRRMKGDVTKGDEDIAHAKAAYPRVGEYFAQFGLRDQQALSVRGSAATDRTRDVINGDVYLRNARFVEFADHRCLPMEWAAELYFYASGSYVRAGELGRTGPAVRKGLEIHKRVEEAWDVFREVNGSLESTKAQFNNLKECVSDVADFFAQPEPVSCALVSEYEKLAIALKRFPDRQTRSDVISPKAASVLRSLGCGPMTPSSQPVANGAKIENFRDCSVCPEMIVIPAGQFMMGSPVSEPDRAKDEGPQHLVTIARPFAVGKFVVTFAEWDACAANGGCKKKPKDTGEGRGRYPVINVSWKDAREYVDWLSRKTKKPYRLLSEAEWEYAARAGSTTMYPWGDEIGIANANCRGCGSDFERTSPVGSYKANAFGLYDMEGNVVQWVEDTVHPSYDGAPEDGSAWIDAANSSHVIRGSSWVSPAKSARLARRNSFPDYYSNGGTGFRVALTLPDPAVATPRPGAVSAAGGPSPPIDCKQAATHWKRAEETKTRDAYEDHLKRFPTCAFAALARMRIERLTRK